jgi:hypothetical protein
MKWAKAERHPVLREEWWGVFTANLEVLAARVRSVR